jgi:hypothetical protein
MPTLARQLSSAAGGEAAYAVQVLGEKALQPKSSCDIHPILIITVATCLLS